MTDFEVLTEELDHPEGVAWGRDGRIYSGGEDGQIYAITLEGEVEEVSNTDGGILGVAVDGAGRVYACDEERLQVLRVDPATGTVEVYATGAAAEGMTVPNALAFDEVGNLYVTDSGQTRADDGAVLRVAPGGRTEVWTRGVPRYPNGCCLTLERDALLVAESYLPGVSRVPILADGSAGEPEAVVELPATVPDGVALDEGGNLYVACYRPDRIYRVSPSGEVEVLADDPHGIELNAPTNLAFVGGGLERLAVANVGEWHLLIGDVGARGAPLAYPDVP